MADFGKLDFAISFDPISAFPLDGRTYFESKEAAEAAARSAEPVGSTNTKYHYGMMLTVCENNDVSLWTIMPDKTLVQVSHSVTLSASAYADLKSSGGIRSGVFYAIEGDVT